MRKGWTSLPGLPAKERAGKREGAARSGLPVAPHQGSLCTSAFKLTTQNCNQFTVSTHSDHFTPFSSVSASSVVENGSVGYLPPQRQAQLLDLIGNRCVVQCQFDDVAVEALWDTGAQASLINEEWRKLHLPHHTVRPVEELVGPSTVIGLAANQTEIPFLGWVEVEFKLGRHLNASAPLFVPILVSSDPNVAELPIIGFNVIEAIISGSDKEQSKPALIQKLSHAFAVTFKTARVMLKLIQTDNGCKVGTVHTGKKRFI